MLTTIQTLALQQLLDQIPVSRPGQADMTVQDIESVMVVHARAVGFTAEQVEEFMLGGDV